MNFTLEVHPKLCKLFRPRPQAPHPKFKHKDIPDAIPFYARTLRELMTPPRLYIHIQTKESAASLWPRFYSDMVDNFMKNTLWTENILSVGNGTTMENPAGKHGFDILSDMFELLNGRLDLFRRIYIDVPEDNMEKNSSGNLLGLAEAPSRLDSTIRSDNASNLREFLWSGHLGLLKDKFQIPFSRFISLSLLINIDNASLLLAKCHDLRAFEIGTLIQAVELEPTTNGACKMPTTWWRHFQTGIDRPYVRVKSQKKTVDIGFQVGVSISSENSLHNDFIRISGLEKSTNLRINESEIRKKESQLMEAIIEDECNVVVENSRESRMMSELDDLDFGSTGDGDQVSLLTLPDQNRKHQGLIEQQPLSEVCYP